MTDRPRRPAAGGGRWIEVPPDRLERWLAGFAENHGPSCWSAEPRRVVVAAADGAVAECLVPFPPLAVDGAEAYGGLLAHAAAPRTVGVLLVRLGGFAAGVIEGLRLVDSKVGSRPVHGRSAAGGWSQQRFARRREGQARVALDAAVEAALRVLVPVAGRLEAVVTGGDRRALDAVLGDDRLAALRPLLTGPLLDVPDPSRRVLEGVLHRVVSVQIRVRDAP